MKPSVVGIVVFRRGHGPGTWREACIREGLANSRKSAELTCHVCGSSGVIDEHSIDAAGYVTPDVHCWNPERPCRFYGPVKLEGWE